MDALVTTQWLADHHDDPDLRVVDATYHTRLPGEPERDAAAEYAAGHIPGALFMDLEGFADQDDPLPSTLPGIAQFQARMQALGLGDGVRLVLYDDAAHHTAARAWVMLRSFGIIDVALLDGGLAKWCAEGRPLETGHPIPTPRPLTVTTSGVGIRDLAAMRANLGSAAEQVVDARSPSRVTGEEADPRPGVAPGHIPGSKNLRYSALFAVDGAWKQGAALATAFDDAGVDLDRPTVLTCGSGITASVLAFGMHLLGRDAAVYDGSWSEWGAQPDLTKATGPA